MPLPKRPSLPLSFVLAFWSGWLDSFAVVQWKCFLGAVSGNVIFVGQALAEASFARALLLLVLLLGLELGFVAGRLIHRHLRGRAGSALLFGLAGLGLIATDALGVALKAGLTPELRRAAGGVFGAQPWQLSLAAFAMGLVSEFAEDVDGEVMIQLITRALIVLGRGLLDPCTGRADEAPSGKKLAHEAARVVGYLLAVAGAVLWQRSPASDWGAAVPAAIALLTGAFFWAQGGVEGWVRGPRDLRSEEFELLHARPLSHGRWGAARAVQVPLRG